MATTETYIPRVKERYERELRPALKDELGLKSVMQVPRTIAPGLTFGAALSNKTPERPCASFPVTTRRIGFGVSVMWVSPLSLTLAEHCLTWGEPRPPRNIHQKLPGGKNA